MTADGPQSLAAVFGHQLTPEAIDRAVAGLPEAEATQMREMLGTLNQAAAEMARLATPTGQWFHVSPQRLRVGTVLTPGRAPATDPEFYAQGFGEDTGTLMGMDRSRSECVWLSVSEQDARFWARRLKAKFLYRVQPTDQPRPWNGTGADGWVTTAAVVLAREKL